MSYQTVIADSDVIHGLNVGYLKFFGIWKTIKEYRACGKRNAIIKIKVFITLLLALPYIFCQYLSYFMIKVDIQKATFLNLHTLPALQMCCKILVFWFRLDSQSKLYDLMRKDFISIPKSNTSVTDEIYEKIAKKSNVLCKAAFVVNTSIVVLSIADPGISVDYILYHTGNMNTVTTGKKKIMGGWYPLPIDKSPFYEIIFAYEMIVMIWGGLFLAVYICMFYQVLMCLYAQFAVLSHHLTTLKFKLNQKTNQRNNSLLYNQLRDIIKDHQKLLSYANELRSVYNPLVTMILGMGIFVLVIAVFQFLFGKKGNPMFIFKFFQFLAYQAIEVSMFCFGSSYIETASSDLQFAIYSSDWYKADVKFRKAAQMMMVRSRKGETLTAIRMYPVNMETIMSILHFTYSVATLMSRMTE
ncbi:odorant receptor 10-like isoform X1 [Halyomorpha halys]|uniref:odorant receptor 10-like isoform X1 n=1 Tax=Halyomorpha halys TaxID=286706 RepID=UPI0034D296EE|nr:Odorant receptor 38 [Halyomorpha halys]